MTGGYSKVRDPAHSAAYVLFHYTWEMHIQNMFTVSSAERELYGTRTSGDPARDARDAERMVRKRLTIVQASMYFERGSKIILGTPYQAIEIYDVIMEHIDYWMNRLKYDIHDNGSAPIDDLHQLDRLAAAVFAPAKQAITNRPVTHRRFKFQRNNGGAIRGRSASINTRPVATTYGTEGDTFLNRGGLDRWNNN